MLVRRSRKISHIFIQWTKAFYMVLWSLTFQKIINTYDSYCSPLWLFEMLKYDRENPLVGCPSWGNRFCTTSELVVGAKASASYKLCMLFLLYYLQFLWIFWSSNKIFTYFLPERLQVHDPGPKVILMHFLFQFLASYLRTFVFNYEFNRWIHLENSKMVILCNV